MKYLKELIILILLSLLVFVFVRENYYGRLLLRINGGVTTSKEVQINLDKLYSNNQYSSDIVFLGNSITNGVDWNELLGLNVSNQGIGGNTTEQISNRLNNVINESPRHVFIMSGINDIYQGFTVDEIFIRYVEILNYLQNENIEPVVQSTLFVTKTERGYFETNDKVKILNSKLKEHCEQNSITYIDLNGILGVNGELSPKYSTDGVHLNSIGYELWYKELVPVLKDLGYYKNTQGELN